MRTTTAGTAGRRPMRWRLDDQRTPGAGLRRGELAAALATAAIAGQLLFAPATLASAVALTAVGRVSRWRPHWLALATAAGVIWLSAAGPARSLTAFGAGSQRLAGFLLAAASHPRLFAHPGVVAAGASRWLPPGLPLAMLAGCGEAWLLLWFGWWRPESRSHSEWVWRPGVVAAVRRPMSAAALRAGLTATSDGCAVGLANDTGKLAGFSWAEAMDGVLLTGRDVDVLGLAVTCAAFRRRKSVMVLDCAGEAAGVRANGHWAGVAERVGLLARSFGVPVTAAESVAAVAALGRAIRRREAVVIGMQTADDARRGVADLAGVLGELRDLGLRADCVAWIAGVEFLDPANVVELLALGPLTGTVVVLSTTSSAHAARLASVVGVMAVGHPVGVDLELAMAARLSGTGDAGAAMGRQIGSAAPLWAGDPTRRPMASAQESTSDYANRVIPVRQRPGEVTLLVISPRRDGSPRVVTNCRVLPIAVDHPQ